MKEPRTETETRSDRFLWLAVVLGILTVGSVMILLGWQSTTLADLGVGVASAAFIAGSFFWLDSRYRKTEKRREMRELEIERERVDAAKTRADQRERREKARAEDIAVRQHKELKQIFLQQMLFAAGHELQGVRLPGADLTGLILRNRDFSGADFTAANLSGADLSGSKLHGATLANATLKRAILRDVAAIDSSFTGANLSGANLEGARLNGADLTDAILDDVDLSTACTEGVTGLPVDPNHG